MWKAITDGVGYSKQEHPTENTSKPSPRRSLEDILNDNNLKSLFGADTPVECFAKIHSYVFRYKPEAQRQFNGKFGMDNDLHYGVMAQELEENPFTRSTVHTDPDSGYKVVDTRELTMANTAAISDIVKELQELKSLVKSISTGRGM